MGRLSSPTPIWLKNCTHSFATIVPVPVVRVIEVAPIAYQAVFVRYWLFDANRLVHGWEIVVCTHTVGTTPVDHTVGSENNHDLRVVAIVKFNFNPTLYS